MKDMDIVTAIATIVALLGLIYQIAKDIYSECAHYKLEIRRVNTEEPDKEFETITIINSGNRAVCIELIGLTTFNNSARLYTFKSSDFLGECDLPFVLKVGEIKVIKIDVNGESKLNFNNGRISVRDSQNKTFHQK